ncbi:MAG TPA: EAL domain-containing protein [Burkholderiaceae bacterium]|nr:EAL domain-containing protein [Burkholderiaceae bacterium]
MPHFRRLRTRLIVAFAILVTVVQAIAFVLVNVANDRNAQAKIGQELAVGERIFGRLLDEKRNQLIQTAGVLSADSSLREAFASRDVATIESTLRSAGRRVGADTMMLIDMKNVIVADISNASRRGKPFPLIASIEAARNDGHSASLALLDGRAYQLVVVPVLAPVPIGWVALGMEIDDEVASDLQKLTELQVSFFDFQAGREPRLLASTLPPSARQTLTDLLKAPSRAGSERLQLRLGGDDYESRLVGIDVGANGRILAVLQRPLDEVRATVEQLRVFLMLLAAVSIPLAVLGSYLIARSITQPLSELTRGALRMQGGDFSAPIAAKSHDELGLLAGTLNHMREGIARREREILRLAYEDGLTRLPNRALLLDRLDQGLRTAIRRSEPLTVMVLDLDRFKEINDMLGHMAGDVVLKQVAMRLQAVLRDSDTVARLGGDEFALVLPMADAELVRVVARRIALALRTPVEFEGQPLDVAASIGSAIFPQHGEDAGTLIRHADAAMYVAKRNNAGHAFYDPSYDVGQREHLSLLSELRRAVEESQLRAYYQPLIDLATGRVRGVEALVRWRHPTRGLLSPVEFMPYAEQTGFVRIVTRWMLAVTVRQCGKWAAQGVPLQVSVNISARDLMNRELPYVIADLLRAHSVPPHLLCLEITESSFMEDPKHAQATLRQLDGLGIKLAIDDFGTGFSSLAYLKKLPVAELKIERSFVMGMTEDKDDRVIVRSTIELAHNLGLHVVAEGVESEACLQQLRELHCDYVQGYLISGPLRRRTLEGWLQESRWGLGTAIPAEAIAETAE